MVRKRAREKARSTRARSVSEAIPAWVSTSFSKSLSGRRGRDTRPEKALRRALHALGVRFRLHVRLAPNLTADLVLRRHRLAVFVDGCFWHGCPRHGKRNFTGPNSVLWERKIMRNRERDARATRFIHSAGWRVLRLWECVILADAPGCARRVMKLLGR
jgi:DNA mismatch endonuclease, patch repair protein